MNVVGIVQARTGSTRLPGKVLAQVAGATVLERMLQRVVAASTISELVVATTTDSADDTIVEICRTAGIRVLRGHPTDLLDRHHHVAVACRADVAVKIPSDCPLIDPAVIDHVIGAYLAAPNSYDYFSNLHPATWPDGNDVEVMPRAALELAWREAKRPLEREHTTPFLWDQPARFRIGNLRWETGLDYSLSHRLVLDYPEDLALIREIYGALWSPGHLFSLTDILDLLEDNPQLRALNAVHLGASWYRAHAGELSTIGTAST